MIGLDVSDRSIKAVEISEGLSRKIRSVCWAPLAPNLMRRGVIQDPASVAQGITATFERCSGTTISGRKVVVSIPETQSFVRVLELPLMSAGELDEAVQWAIRQHIPFDLDRVYLDWQQIGQPSEDNNRQEVLVGAAQRDVVDPLLEVVDQAGLQVVALELEAQAIARSLLPGDGADIERVLLIDLGATSTNIIFYHQGAIRFTTSIQRGGDDFTQIISQQLNLNSQEAAQEKALVGVSGSQNAEVASVLQQAASSLINQIAQVVGELATRLNVQEQPRAILLSGGSANLPGIVNIFSSTFAGIPIQIGNPLINLEVDDDVDQALSPADSTHFVTAIGLALREVNYIE